MTKQMNPLKYMVEKYHRSDIFKRLKSFRKKDDKLTQAEYVHRINKRLERLPEGKTISQNQLSEYVNSVKSPSPEVRELMIEIMGEEAGAVYPWYERVVVPLRKQVKELQDTILHLSPDVFKFSWRRMLCRAVSHLIICASILAGGFIYCYRGAVVESVADRLFKSYEERIEERDAVILELRDLSESQGKRIESLDKKLKKTRKGLVEKGELVMELEEKKRKAE
ncbi:MAG: hypothetical protein JW984_15135 [Deltaproteobacteria bacterium]|uniref:Uncharacterized protein n=1 Tax=Candidatus Zymogenus saltonus TaxID=2844893 RepID=A0A9D8KIL3_9DELT|nr:hypothetical protein [Candidatus Zymogenus saltonus]